MKKFLLFILFIFPFPVFAEMNFDSYIVKDMNSGRVFEEKASNNKRLPASTTKIMTAIVAIENSNLTDIVKVGNEILTIDGTNIYTEIGESLLMQDLLYGMLLRSGNDAATSIANFVGGSVSNFVKMMNDKARTLKLYNTTFNNPTGLDDYEKNYSTVSDLATIYSYAYQNKEFRKIIKTKKYITSSDKKSYLFNNRSKIIFTYDKCTGAKTGYTPSAGRLLVSSARDNNLDLVIVTAGNNYGFEDHINKYKEIFNEYNNYLIIKKGNLFYKSKLHGKLYIKNGFSYPLSEKEIDSISKKIIFNNKKHNYVGDIIIYKDNEVIHKEKVYLKESNKSLFNKIKNFFNKD